MTRLEHIGCKTAVIGISGGLDSTLALLVTVLAFDRLGLDRRGIIGITMPGFGTTGRTHRNAVDLMTALGVTQREISIVPCVTRHFEDIGQDPSVHDVTYENAQARERTQILMDVANKENGLVVGTGDLSELALGWATYNGDHMSMYGVNASIPKTLVKYLVKWAAENNFGSAVAGERSAREILLDVVDTPISPELTPADDKGQIKQKTEDLVGPYELHDFFLYNMFRFGYSPSKIFFMAKKAFIGKKEDASVFLGPEGKFNEYDEQTILKWLKKFYWRFFSQQFKRSCLPDGPKVGSVSLSPRGDLRMPSDAKVALWIADLDKLQ
jgi:NAD+ synthase (glutamine-hydrolysing)